MNEWMNEWINESENNKKIHIYPMTSKLLDEIKSIELVIILSFGLLSALLLDTFACTIKSDTSALMASV